MRTMARIGLVALMLAVSMSVLAYAVDFSYLVTFYSEINGGPIRFTSNIVADRVTWSSYQIRFENFTHGVSQEWAEFGLRCPSTGTMNVTLVDGNLVNFTLTTSGTTTFTVWIGDRATPSNVTNVDVWSHVGEIIYFDISSNTDVSIIWGGGAGSFIYTITLDSLYDQVESGLYTLLYANATDPGGGTNGDNVTFTVDGVSFAWNTYTLRYEGQVMKSIPQTAVFNSVDSFTDTENANATGTVTQPVTVVWTTDSLTNIQNFAGQGDLFGLVINTWGDMITVGGFYTLAMMLVSVGIYLYTGPEATLLAWLMGWGIFGWAIQAQGLGIALIMIALGGGIYIARLFVSRRRY